MRLPVMRMVWIHLLRMRRNGPLRIADESCAFMERG